MAGRLGRAHGTRAAQHAYALLEQEDAKLPDILPLYTNERYRKQLVKGVRNDTVRHFWQKEFEHYHFRQKADAVAPIQNKLGALLSDPTLHRILVTPQVDLKFRSLMDEGGCSSSISL